MLPECDELIARGIPVTYRDRVCELCGADLMSERAILCRRRRIELREAAMRDTELRAVLPRWRRDGLTPPEMADRLRLPVWRVLDALRALVNRSSDHGVRALCAAVAVSVLVGLLAASAAMAGKLPEQGIWDYENTATTKIVAGVVVFEAYLNVNAGTSNLRLIQGQVLGGTCKTKNGRIIGGAPVPFHLNGYTKGVILVKADGSFAAIRHSDEDVSRGATFTVKGVFNGVFVTGTVTAHTPHDPVWGDCKGTGKFVRARGTQIG